MDKIQKENLIKKIKEKKELCGINSKLIERVLEDYIFSNRLKLDNLSKSEEKVVLKDVRKELRNLSGQFRKGMKNREEILDSKNILKLAETHTSTAERKEFYSELKKIIYNLHPKSILDLACGLNPIFLARKDVFYYASDIQQEELNLINNYFKKEKIAGKTFFYDLKKISNDLPKADLCLLFKVLDILGDKKLSEKIILTIPCEKILVSFPTKKLSGKSMNFPRRIWFEKMLSRKAIRYSSFGFSNEIFYLISK